MLSDRETQERRIEALETLKAEMQRRLEDKIARCKAIRVKLGTQVCSHVADGFIEQREADELLKLRQGGETREVLFEYEDVDARGQPIEPIAVIETGVPRSEKNWRNEQPTADVAREIDVGHVDDGFEFMGGDPNFESNWKKLP
jgi:hypothetical protein